MVPQLAKSPERLSTCYTCLIDWNRLLAVEHDLLCGPVAEFRHSETTHVQVCICRVWHENFDGVLLPRH